MGELTRPAEMTPVAPRATVECKPVNWMDVLDRFLAQQDRTEGVGPSSQK